MFSLLKTFAVALVLKTRSWRKDIAFLLNYMRVQSCRSLETFHLSFCGASFWPWFSPWLFTRTYLPFSDFYLKVDSFVFSPGLHRCPLRSLVQRLVFTTYVSIFSSGRFWLTLLCYPVPLYGVNTVVTLGFAFHLLSPFCLGLVRDFGGGEQASFHVAWLLPPLGLLAPDYFPQVLWQSTSGSPPTLGESAF